MFVGDIASLARFAVSSLLVGGVCALGGALLCGVLAYREGVSVRRGRMLLCARFLVGAAFCLGGLAVMIIERALPIIQSEGIIESVSVHSQNRGFRSEIQVRVASGGLLALHASGRDSYFRPGEHVRLRYQGYTGLIRHVEFMTPDGQPEGVFQDAGFLTPYGLLLVGAVIIVIGIRKYRRDPEGAVYSDSSKTILGLDLSDRQ